MTSFCPFSCCAGSRHPTPCSYRCPARLFSHGPGFLIGTAMDPLAGTDMPKKLERVRKAQAEWGKNVPAHIKAIQDERVAISAALVKEGKGLWNDVLVDLADRYVRHQCLVCGYSFGDESCNYDGGWMKKFLEELAAKMKDAHAEVCRSGIYSY